MVKIYSASLGYSDFKSVVINNKKVEIPTETSDSVAQSYEFLEAFARNKVIYGINTGFGPMAQFKIPDADQKELQLNLIRSHASGMGTPLTPSYVRASMLARLNTLCLAKSGVHPSAIQVLQDLINHEVYPLIPQHGGVGASGDLVQLAHLALGMLGEGKAQHKGEWKDTSEWFKIFNIKPMQIALREGLAVMNGTGVMTGIGIVNSVYAQRALEWSVVASVMICELVNAYDDYFSAQLNEAKKHPGQRKIAEVIRTQIAQSKHFRKREVDLYEKKVKEGEIGNKVQEYYSIRCVPQILGPILEGIDDCVALLINEVNSANDNPIVDIESQNVYHGGNFHGDYVSYEMDKLKMGITKLSMVAERQLNFIMNPNLNGILPPFANLGVKGFNYGMQGAQFTATSTTAENQTLSNPMYVHSIPNNNDNQDIVSMGTNSALMAQKVIDNTFEVLSIELLSIAQAVDHLNKYEGMCPASQKAYDKIRRIKPKFTDDQPLFGSLAEIKKALLEESPLNFDFGVLTHE